MLINSRATLYIFIKYIAVSFLLLLGGSLVLSSITDDGNLDTLSVFIFSLTMAFAINEAYRKGERQHR